SYGKDLGVGLETLLGELAGVEGVEWLRLSYLQPAEIRPSLIEAVAVTPHVVPYFDLPFQHASGPVLKRMRRYGDGAAFLALLAQIRAAVPAAGIRTNVIVGFPGETAADVDALTEFLGAADLDAVGVFPYSDEEGTAGARLDGHLDEAEILARTADVAQFADTVTAARAAARTGETVTVLVESAAGGRAAQQGPEDGRTYLPPGPGRGVGDIVVGRITATDGVDWQVDDGRGTT
ncbi:MAG: MiaB/RimO family radical SAM methylthiotransferase, partial [Propionibacteriaceae bacterium]|nr:MiaB/RimO family radical SAM methylthiotransferase [Propionibacteriaceae bacterium]